MTGEDQRLLDAIFPALNFYGENLSVHPSDLHGQDVGHLLHGPDNASYLPIEPVTNHTSFLASTWEFSDPSYRQLCHLGQWSLAQRL